MSNVPSNLVPTRITELPEYDGVDANGWVPFVISGRTFKANLGSLAGGVPASRTVTAGTGLLGGGALATDITLSADLSSATPQALGVADPGVSSQMSRDDHVHPAVDLSDATQITGVLPVENGGTGGVTTPRLIAFFFTSAPTASEVLALYTAVESFTLASNFSGSRGKCGTNPTSSFVLTVQKNSSTVGTVTIATNGTFTFATSGGSAVSLVAGDQIKVTGPASPDATVANVSITFKGAA